MLIELTDCASAVDATLPPSFDPNAPKSTFENERFIALLIRIDRMKPDAPSSDPEMMRMTLPSANPVAHDARPEYEFRSATTTGMSAPPIGITNSSPNRSDPPTIVQNAHVCVG